MIGYEMGSSLAKVYTMSKASLVKNFKDEWKNDMDANMATRFARGVLWKSSFMGNLQPLNKKLGLPRTPTRDIFLKFFFPSCPTY
jgi:hypothetical protein